MKIILTGCTGFIGAQVLAHCLAHPSISHIIALSRRPLPPTTPEHANPKLRVLLLQDFTSYPASVLEELRDADGCIWSIGTFTGDEAIDVAYPLAFCNAMLSVLPPGKKFHYVHLGGGFTEPPDSGRRLWFLAQARRVRGKAEAEVLAFAREEGENRGRLWETFVVKPGGVLASDGWARAILSWVLGPQWTIVLDELAAAMVDVVLNGSEKKVWENAGLVERGRELLARSESDGR